MEHRTIYVLYKYCLLSLNVFRIEVEDRMIFYNPAEPVRRLNTTFMFKISPFTQEQLDCIRNVMWQNI